MNLNQLTIKEAHKGLKDKEFSSLDLTNACIERIEKTDERLDALLETNFDEARKQANAIDKAGISDNQLSGIPNTIKDILLTKGITTTASSNMLRNYVPPFNATAVQKVLDRGSVILGKNNLDAWAHGSSTENSDFGPTKNPWDLDRVPGGSSGGSAASVAADQCLFSLGSDTGGSIRQPAAYCGVVGVKPTYGRVSRYGSIAMGSSLDCIGPITKTVEDAAIVLEAISGNDLRDATTPGNKIGEYVKAATSEFQKVSIGVPKQVREMLSGEAKQNFEDSLKVLESLGAKISEIDMTYLEYGIASYYIVMPSEVSSNLGRYDGVRYGYRNDEAKDLFEVYTKSRSKGLGAEAKRRIMIGTYVLSAGYYDAYYKKAMKVRTLIKREFEELFGTVDLIAMPTTNGPAFKLGEKASDPLAMYLEDVFTVTANMAGVPSISVPAGLVDGLPVGLQLLANQFEEERLFNTAAAFERSVDFKRQVRL